MFESFINSLPEIASNIFTLQTMLAITLGVIGGMVIGALPGLSATMGIALMIPFTYAMEPVAALAMLMTIYTSAIAGGSISAILIHTPGTPSSAATALDGYPLTQRGRGLEALGLAMLSSCLGGFISSLALLFISPLLAQVALKFGSAENFFLGLFGLSIIASLASKSLSKGLIAGFLGLLLGTIGIDNNSAYPRFTLGITEMLSGIPSVPALIGLFSIPQVMTQIEKARKADKTAKDEIGEIKGRALPRWKDFRKLLPTIGISSVLGIMVGILPGAGGDIGSWVGYNSAKNRSKNPDLFGKGSLEGICASEAANNAVTGGAVIPMLTLGIPGSAAASVLMGGLMIHGMTPGGALFTKQATTTFAIILGFMLANLFMGVLGILISRYVVNVTKVPTGVLCPIIVVLAVVGSYAISGNMYNVYVMIVFGLLGYFMRKADYPASATVLGLILGKMTETGLRQSITMSRGNLLKYFTARPICIALVVLVLFSMSYPFISASLKAKKAKAAQNSEKEEK